MPRKRFTSEQIISKLGEAEVALAKGKAVPLVCKQIGVHVTLSSPSPSPSRAQSPLCLANYHPHRIFDVSALAV